MIREFEASWMRFVKIPQTAQIASSFPVQKSSPVFSPGRVTSLLKRAYERKIAEKDQYPTFKNSGTLFFHIYIT